MRFGMWRGGVDGGRSGARLRSRAVSRPGRPPLRGGSAPRRPAGRLTGRRGRIGTRAALAAALAASLSAPPAGAQTPDGAASAVGEETVSVEVGGSTLRLPVSRQRGYKALDVTHLTGTLLADVTLGRDEASGRLGSGTLHLRAGSPFFRHGDRVFQLANPPYASGGTLWVPAELLTAWLPEVAGSAGPSTVGEAGEVVAPVASARAPGPWRVVIDPGHGGKDPGTRAGRARTREKEVVLGIARRLQARLAEMPDIEPILTRDRDEFVTVRGRPNMALAREGDLFLSIHANSAPSRSARGFETYYLGEARTDESRQVAMRENAALQYEENAPQLGDIQFILASNDLSGYRRESSKLGGYVQNAMRRIHPGPDRGVKPGPYWVLVGASGSMPTVLVEVGFLSHPDEERFLASASGQERLADALAEAVRTYLDAYGRQVGPPQTVEAAGTRR